MAEKSLFTLQAVVMLYDDSSRQWVPRGSPPFLSNVFFLYNIASDTYRFVGIDVLDNQVILESEVYKGLKYNQATPVFHQWRDNSRQVYGVKFSSQEDADAFADAIRSALDPSYKSQRTSVEVHAPNSYITDQTNKAPTPAPAQSIYHSTANNQQIDDNPSGYGSGYSSTTQPVTPAHGRYSEPMYSSQTSRHAGGLVSNGQMAVVPPSAQQTARRQSSYEQNGTTAGQGSTRVSLGQVQPQQQQMPDNSSEEVHSLRQHRSASFGNAIDDAAPSSVVATTGTLRSSRATEPNLASSEMHGGSGNLSAETSGQDSMLPSRISLPSQVPTPAPPPPPAPGAPPPPPPPPPPPQVQVASSGGLADALKAAQLRKTATATEDSSMPKAGSMTLGRPASSRPAIGGDMMSEMAKRLQARRAKAEGAASSDSEGQSSGKDKDEREKSEKSFIAATPLKTPVASASKDSPRLERKWQPSSQAINTQLPANVATQTDLENLKKELTLTMRTEIASAKQDILDAISRMMSNR